MTERDRSIAEAAWHEGHTHCFHVEDPNNKQRNPYVLKRPEPKHSRQHYMAQISVWMMNGWVDDLRRDCSIFIENHFEAALNRLKYGVDSPHGDGWHPPTWRHPSTLDPGLRLSHYTHAQIWMDGADWMYGEIAEPPVGQKYPLGFQYAPGDNPHEERGTVA